MRPTDRPNRTDRTSERLSVCGESNTWSSGEGNWELGAWGFVGTHTQEGRSSREWGSPAGWTLEMTTCGRRAGGGAVRCVETELDAPTPVSHSSLSLCLHVSGRGAVAVGSSELF